MTIATIFMYVLLGGCFIGGLAILYNVIGVFKQFRRKQVVDRIQKELDDRK